MTLTIDAPEVLTGQSAVDESYSWKPKRVDTPKFLGMVAEAADLFGAALSGNRRKMLDLQEALSTSDFPILLGSVFERELLSTYEDIDPIWPQFASRTVVKDFRPKKFIDLFGGKAILDPIAQATEYPARSKSEAEYELSVGKRGGRFHITWEDTINDDLDALRSLPTDLAQGAQDTEDYLAAKLLFSGATGAQVNGAFFKAGNDNAPGNLPLTAENLDATLTRISQRTDKEKRPIIVRGQVLVVGPGLATAARKILNATELRFQEGDKTVITSNYMAGAVRLVVNPWLPVVSPTLGNRAWFVLPEPNSSRKALTLGFLRGHETPDIRVKADAGNSLSGGAVNPEEGSFDNDTTQYRVRIVTGAATLDPIATAASVTPA